MAPSFRSMILAASVFALPSAAVLAQTPGSATADHAPLGTPNTSGNPALSGSPNNMGSAAASQTPGVPGATGRTVVPGNNSTISADRPGTAMGKTDGASGSGK